MARRPTLSDVARDAGVSPATVSRAISQPDLLAAETLARVRSSALRLGFQPDAAARALASGRTMTMGAVVPTLDNAIFSRALHALQNVLSASGYQLLVASNDYSAATEAESVGNLLSRGVDGLVLVGAEHAPETFEKIDRSGTPVVLTLLGLADRPCVSVDNVEAGRLVARHLIGLGHRRIGMVTGRLAFNDRQRARLAGVRGILADAKVELPDWLVTEQPMSLAGGRQGAAKLMELAEPPTAIIGGIDLIAIGCVVEAQARGLQVPADISIAGIDDLDMSAHISPALTTVHIPTARIGAEAGRLLVALANGQAAKLHHDLPAELVVRRSTGAPPHRTD